MTILLKVMKMLCHEVVLKQFALKIACHVNSQCEHGQPMEQTRSLFCMCDSGVARCQSQHQCHFWRINLLHWQVSLAAVNQICVFHEAMNGCKNLKIHSKM